MRVTPETKDRLDELARITNRSKAYLLEQAIASYLDRNNWQVEAISQAVKEADRPDAKWVSQKDVEDRFL